jgi:hypothetical protein
MRRKPMSNWHKIVQPYDLLFTWRHFLDAENPLDLAVSKAIEWITEGPSHVRLYLGQGPFGEKTFWEVTYPKCRFGSLNEIDLAVCDLEIGYHIYSWLLEPEEEWAIISEAQKLIGRKYDVMELFDHLLDELGIDHKQDSDPDRYVCSTGVVHLFRRAGLYFWRDLPEQLISPQDIRESKFYRYRWRSFDDKVL